MLFKYPRWFLIYGRAGVLTLHLQVFLCLEVLDCGVVYNADHGYAIVLLVNGERQLAGYCVHLVIGQLDFGLAYGKKTRLLRNRDAGYAFIKSLQKAQFSLVLIALVGL